LSREQEKRHIKSCNLPQFVTKYEVSESNNNHHLDVHHQQYTKTTHHEQQQQHVTKKQ
jgi:hypothetical protein